MASLLQFGPMNAEPPSANAPELGAVNAQLHLAFDASTDETVYWTFIAPQGITTPLTLVVKYKMASATTGAVRFEGLVEAITDGDSLNTDTTDSFDTTNSAGDTVPGTAGHLGELSITLTNADSIAAGDRVRILLRRDADGTTGTDDATGDCRVTAVELRDAA